MGVLESMFSPPGVKEAALEIGLGLSDAVGLRLDMGCEAVPRRTPGVVFVKRWPAVSVFPRTRADRLSLGVEAVGGTFMPPNRPDECNGCRGLLVADLAEL